MRLTDTRAGRRPQRKGGDEMSEEIEALFALFRQFEELGPLARLRYRAEVLLRRLDDEEHPVEVSDADREELERITVAPREDDEEFLGRFDYIYERDVERE